MSESSLDRPGGLVVGTAGHIDHGKTSLVQALTGIDTDRLAEEKRRGISIDLGFAHLSVPNGRAIGFVDVPGHERFIKNMLAGAVGIHAVLLVVAADESVKPQTREHFDICRLLGIREGIVVLTKADLASAEQIRKTCDDIRSLCAGSFLERAPIVTTSTATGQGLNQLRAELSSMASRMQPPNDSGLVRLPIDRSFALRGFGTVVTGTLWSGKLHVGDTVRLHPSLRELRVRGLQVHGEAITEAVAGQRTAVNLSGIDSPEIRRGHVLTHPDPLEMTKLLDVSLEWLAGVDIPRTREDFLLHTGTAEVSAALKTLPVPDGESQVIARLWLSEAVLALPGDRLVIRQPSPARTVAGGFVIDAFPAARLNRTRRVRRLKALVKAGPAERVQILVEESAGGRRVHDLIRLTGLPETQLQSIIARNPALVFVDVAQHVVTQKWIQEKRQKLLAWLTTFHAKNPSVAGAPVSLARMGLEPHLAAVVWNGLAEVRVEGGLAALAKHKATLSSQETQTLAKLEGVFRQGGFQPPAPAEAMTSAGTDPKQTRALLEALIKRKILVRVSDDLIFHAETITHIRNSLAAHKGRRFSVPEFKQWTQISRKFAIPLLEYLDRERVTRREGDVRIVL